MAEQIPPEVQQELVKLQQLQAQLSQVLTEKELLRQELRDIERTLSVLKDLPQDAELYRSTGHILVRVSKDDVEKELNERKELVELRLKTLEKQESMLRQQLSQVQSKVNQYLSKVYKGQGGA